MYLHLRYFILIKSGQKLYPGDIGPSRSHRRDEIHQAVDREVEPHSSICSRIATGTNWNYFFLDK